MLQKGMLHTVCCMLQITAAFYCQLPTSYHSLVIKFVKLELFFQDFSNLTVTNRHFTVETNFSLNCTNYARIIQKFLSTSSLVFQNLDQALEEVKSFLSIFSPSCSFLFTPVLSRFIFLIVCVANWIFPVASSYTTSYNYNHFQTSGESMTL